MKGSRSPSCSLTVMFSFIVSFFFAWIFKVPTPETLRFGFKGVEGEGISVQLCSASFVFLHSYFSNVAHCGRKIEKTE